MRLPAGNKAMMEIRRASSATKYLHAKTGVFHFSWAIYEIKKGINERRERDGNDRTWK